MSCARWLQCRALSARGKGAAAPAGVGVGTCHSRMGPRWQRTHEPSRSTADGRHRDARSCTRARAIRTAALTLRPRSPPSCPRSSPLRRESRSAPRQAAGTPRTPASPSPESSDSPALAPKIRADEQPQRHEQRRRDVHVPRLVYCHAPSAPTGSSRAPSDVPVAVAAVHLREEEQRGHDEHRRRRFRTARRAARRRGRWRERSSDMGMDASRPVRMPRDVRGNGDRVRPSFDAEAAGLAFASVTARPASIATRCSARPRSASSSACSTPPPRPASRRPPPAPGARRPRPSPRRSPSTSPATAWPRSTPAAHATIMLDGHIDEIGVIVQYIDDDGYVYIAPIGGWDPQVLVGQRIRFLGNDGDVHRRRGQEAHPPHEARRPREGEQVHRPVGGHRRHQARGGGGAARASATRA